METWRNIGDAAKLASFLAEIICACLCKLLEESITSRSMTQADFKKALECIKEVIFFVCGFVCPGYGHHMTEKRDMSRDFMCVGRWTSLKWIK
ncbi:hypothetical protein TNCV_478761 [Trichonephila clavipes]|nr:hypothetical protein TNCV_478761 [Trichonephila clavipes]